MICTTVKEGVECPFMTGRGCSFNGGVCHEIVEQCNGCNRNNQFNSGWFCAACPDPAVKWKNGNCNLATHITTASSTKAQKLNPLKASKRGGR